MGSKEFFRREKIKGTVEDLVGELLWYGRKEDEELPRGAIQDAIEAGEITRDDIVTIFADELKKHI